jgi:hypothetical protein
MDDFDGYTNDFNDGDEIIIKQSDNIFRKIIKSDFITELSDVFQTRVDNNLETVSQTVVGGINEVNSIAKGATQAESDLNYSDFITNCNGFAITDYNIGQSWYIVTLEVPDLWFSATDITNVPYTYTTDQQFIDDVNSAGGALQVGNYYISFLENQKIDLTNFIQGSGTINYIPKFDDTRNIVDSIINEVGGNIGIDITNPTEKLEVNGNVIFNYTDPKFYLRGRSSGIPKMFFSRYNGNDDTLGAKIQYIFEGANQQESGGLAFYTNANTSAGATLSEKMRINANGNIGIGIEVTDHKLCVAEDLIYVQAESGQLCLSDITGDKRLLMGYDSASNVSFIESVHFGVAYKPLILNPTSGKVGIGVNPQTKFHITDTNAKIRIANSTSNAGDIGVEFSHSTHPGLTETKTAIISSAIGAYGKSDLHFILDSADDSSGYNIATDTKMIIKNSGDIGINVEPLAKLDVNGDSRFGDSTTNYTEFTSDGTLIMNGTATVWDDAQIPLISTTKQTPSGEIITNEAEQTLDFKTNATIIDYAIASIQLSHKWKIGSDILAHIHWEQTVAGIPNWLLQYRWQQLDSAKVTVWTDIAMNTPVFTYVSGTLNQISNGADIVPPVGAGVSDILQFRVIRDTTNISGLFAGVDPVATDLSATSFDFHYEIDTLGSSEPYVK